MNRTLSNTADIKPQLGKPWTVLVQLLESRYVHISKGKGDFRRLVFTDTQGTIFAAVIFSNHLQYFRNLLLPYKKYYISNAMVMKSDPKYRISTYPYSWMLNNKTPIEELILPTPATLPCNFEFTNFRQLHKHADTENGQNIRAIVLRCFQSKEIGSEPNKTRRDIVIVNEEKMPMMLTLWNEYDENEGCTLANIIDSGPVIFGIRLKVTTFNYLIYVLKPNQQKHSCAVLNKLTFNLNKSQELLHSLANTLHSYLQDTLLLGLSLTTRGTSGLMINPPAVESLHMKEWYNNNKDEIQELLDKEAYKNPSLLLPYPKNEDVTSIGTVVPSLKTSKTAWIRGKMTLNTKKRPYWYTACANCQKSINADITWIVTCPSCKLQSEIQPLSVLTIGIDDGTGYIQATISTPEVEKFIPFSALQLEEAEEMNVDLTDEIASSIQQHSIVAFIRSYELTFHGQPDMKVTIVKSYISNESPPPNDTYPAPTNTTVGSTSGSPTDKRKQQSTPSSPTKVMLPSFASITKDLTAQLTHESPTKKAKETDT